MVGGGEDFAVFIKADFEGGAPFGEAEAHLVIFLQTGGEAVEAFGVGFFGVFEFFEALVDFDAGDDAFGCEIFDEILAVVGELAGGFVKENDATDVIFEVVGGEKDVTIVATVVVSIGNV